jgi:hypothetical protein
MERRVEVDTGDALGKGPLVAAERMRTQPVLVCVAAAVGILIAVGIRSVAGIQAERRFPRVVHAVCIAVQVDEDRLALLQVAETNASAR